MAHSPLYRAALPGLALAALLAGCPSNPATPAGPDATVDVPPDASTPDQPDTGTTPDQPDTGTNPAGPDAGTPDTGPAVQPCSNDDECGPTERCSEAGGCMPAVTCDEPANCVPGHDQDTARLYCDNTTGLGCRCVKGGSAPDAGSGADGGGTLGYCKRRLPPCAPCETDEQCGDTAFFRNLLHEPAKCLALGGFNKVCLEQYVSAKCACGKSTFIDGAPYCTPQAPLTCDEGLLCCSDNAQCPAEHPFCGASGRCEDVCWYDYSSNKTVGCRADKVCNVDPAFLFPPENPLYGAGRCANPCVDDAECQQLFGRQDYVCRAETKSAKRCRPQGCIDDGDGCTTPDLSYGYRGYCNRATQVCVCQDPGNPELTCDCRTTANPVTNQPYEDCVPGFKCAEPGPGQPGECVEKTCAERNGAQAYCRYGQFCCGEDRGGPGGVKDGVIETCKDPTGADIPFDPERLNCYYAPAAHWCLGCQSHQECNAPTLPVSSHQPSPDYNICQNLGDPYGPRCLVACMLDSECPKGFACIDFPVDCSNCDPAQCYDTGLVDQDGNPIKQCKCTNKGQKGGECPALDPQDPTQPVARCSDTLDTRNGNNTYFCQWTRVCNPSVAGVKNACAPH